MVPLGFACSEWRFLLVVDTGLGQAYFPEMRAYSPRLLAGDAAALGFAFVCQWLSRWQWSRAHQADGGVPNYMYALQWLAFGLFGFGLWAVTRVQLMRQVVGDRPSARSGDAARTSRVDLPKEFRLPTYPALTARPFSTTDPNA